MVAVAPPAVAVAPWGWVTGQLRLGTCLGVDFVIDRAVAIIDGVPALAVPSVMVTDVAVYHFVGILSTNGEGVLVVLCGALCYGGQAG